MSRDKTKELKPQEGEWWVCENNPHHKRLVLIRYQEKWHQSKCDQYWDDDRNVTPIERLYTEAEAKELLGNSEEFKAGDEVSTDGGGATYLCQHPHHPCHVVELFDGAIITTISVSRMPSPEEIKEKEYHAILYWLGGKDAMSITGLSVRADELHALGIRVIDGELKRV